MSKRRVTTIEPTKLTLSLRTALSSLAEVRDPGGAEEPILAAPVRAAVFGWLAELNAADELRAAGMTPRATALLSGPPGCGKTTLAHHLAARLGYPLVCVGAENLFHAHLGGSEQQVKKLFDALERTEAPCVVLLDEIDAIGSKRTDETGGGAISGRNSMLTVLLRRIESFEGLLVAATNRADALDPALWRRFGMQIDVALPDDESRWAILKRYGLPFSFDDETLDVLTEITAGAAPSLLRQMMEGLKRRLILGPRLRRPETDLAGALAEVSAEVAPHPDYEPPPLWSLDGLRITSLDALAGLPWPPARME